MDFLKSRVYCTSQIYGGDFAKFGGLLYRGCPIIIWTGLIIKIGIVQKYMSDKAILFAKMIPRLDNHFGKILAWSLKYFLNYAYFDI